MRRIAMAAACLAPLGTEACGNYTGPAELDGIEARLNGETVRRGYLTAPVVSAAVRR